MFEELGFRLLAVSVTVLTVVLGTIWVSIGLVMAIENRSRPPRIGIPYALNTLALSVLFQYAAMLVLFHIPHDYGLEAGRIIWLFCLVGSFALGIGSWLLARRISVPSASMLRKGSALLVIIWGLGLLAYIVPV